jgi:cysteinyl-tRNA synthetase
MYSCGLTVYAPMHIGHARTYCFWDLFRRYLEYLGYHVVSVINYTDIDDRIMERVGASAGCMDLAEEVSASFRLDCRRLRIKDYAVYTRATDFIDEQVEIVAALLEKGHAYVVDGEVFYDVTSFGDYGQLSGNTLEGIEAGASGRVDEDVSRKRHPADFTLWKPSGPDEPSWETGHADWPSGRPGWHVECSAMSTTLHGTHFDLHGGAVDNLFPHHENEIAQSQPLCGKPWVRFWLHPAHLDLGDVKMSKSLGNTIGVPEVLARHRYEDLRWFFAMNHYRTRVSYTDELVDQAAEGFRTIERLVRVLEERLSEPEETPKIPEGGDYASARPEGETIPRFRHHYLFGAYGELTAKLMQRFREGMDDDLSTSQATAAVFGYVNELYAAGIEQSDDLPSMLAAYRALTRHLYVLGVEFPNERLYPELAAECWPLETSAGPSPEAAALDRLLDLRQEARAVKVFARAELIRELLAQAGVEVEDTPRGPRWSL